MTSNPPSPSSPAEPTTRAGSLEYQPHSARSGRRRFAWVPVLSTWIAIAGPVGYMSTNPIAPVATAYRDFGLRLNPQSQFVIDFVYRFASFQLQTSALAVSLALGFAVAYAWPDRPKRDARRAAAILLGAALVSALLIVGLQYMLVVRPYVKLFEQITGR